MANAGSATERTDGARFKWLWQNYARKHVPLLAVAFLLMSIEGSVVGGVSLLMEPMFDRVFVEGSTAALWLVGGGMLALFSLRAFTGLCQRILRKLLSERMKADMRQDLLDHCMTLDEDFHSKHPPGYLIERVQGDAAVVVGGASTLLLGLSRDLISLVILLGVAISIDPIWTLVSLSGAPLIYLPTLAIQRYIRKISHRAREVAARMSLRLDEVFHGIASVKLNRLESYQSARYLKANRERIRTETRGEAGRALMPALVDLITGLGIVGVLAYGGGEIVSGEKTVGEFMSFFTAIALMFEPVRRLGALSGLAKTMAASLENMQKIFDERPRVVAPAAPKSISAGDVTFEGAVVRFGDNTALNGLSFTAKAGQTTALVGASGAGKTTVFQTLTRLAPLNEGRVSIGGTDITDVDLGDLRSLFSVVSQEALLFDETIRENITFGAKIPEETLQSALEDAFVTDFLPNQPNGIETEVGPRGSNLSGGQRQRVTIARALLRNSPILLLDEATSALDAESEVKVQEALNRLSEGRTTLVIAHRLSTIRDADRILVLDRGRLAEDGTHDELLAKDGLYARLHALQFRDI